MNIFKTTTDILAINFKIFDTKILKYAYNIHEFYCIIKK